MICIRLCIRYSQKTTFNSGDGSMLEKMPMTKQQISNDAGFTLLEIIAVMVIMSILAVVAVPKYFDLQADAKKRAMETAMAEAVGRVNGYFAQQILNGSALADIAYTVGNLGTDLGDFTLSVTDNGYSETAVSVADCAGTDDAGGVAGCVDLTVSANTGTAVAGADDLTRHVPRPGGI